jgi:NAD(P)H-quinone oxidoreductase subunit I
VAGLKFKPYGLGILKGLVVTMKNFFRPPITLQYPEEKLVMSRRTRGNDLVWSPERCTGCVTCAKACPQGNIRIVTHTTPDKKSVVDEFEIDTGRCMFCGLCVESCPFNALSMGQEYERSTYRRPELILNKASLSSKDLQPSGYARPETAARLPEQTLLVNWDKKEGQRLSWLPFRKRKQKK